MDAFYAIGTEWQRVGVMMVRTEVTFYYEYGYNDFQQQKITKCFAQLNKQMIPCPKRAYRFK